MPGKKAELETKKSKVIIDEKYEKERKDESS